MSPQTDGLTYDSALLGDAHAAAQAAGRLRERLLGRVLAIVDRRLKQARLEVHSAEVIDRLLETLFSTTELRRLAGMYHAEQGRTWDNYVLQQVHWGVQDAIKRLRRRTIASIRLTDADPPTAEPAPVVATDLPPKMAAKVDHLPSGQRAVWTLRCAPTFAPRSSDREVMAQFSARKQDEIDADVFRLTAEMRGREADRERAPDLTLKMAKLRRAIGRREDARLTLLGPGVGKDDLESDSDGDFSPSMSTSATPGPACRACGEPMTAEDRFCGACGKSRLGF